MTTAPTNGNAGPKKIYVTLSGLPLSFDFKWPFHKSTSGADFWVLHADIHLEDSVGLKALVAVNLSATVHEVVHSLESKDIEGPVINSLRKDVDRHQLEFLKSGKLVPVHFSSRHYDFKRNKWVFGKASEEQIKTLLARKVFWQTKMVGGSVWVGDPTEALYVESTPEYLLNLARALAKDGIITLEGEYASANASLLSQAESFEADKRRAIEELEKKHAYERG
jgi:hypothetical protein